MFRRLADRTVCRNRDQNKTLSVKKRTRYVSSDVRYTIGYKDPIEQKEYQARHYQTNKPKYRRRTKHTRTLLRQWIRSKLEGLECVKCGENDSCAIDLHHLDPTNKEYTIASIATHTTNKDKILSEIEKCVPLCSNCHRKHHAGRLEMELSAEHLIKTGAW